MKELSIEEKVRRYDEAIEVARKYRKDCKRNRWVTECMENIFPELKESEDERIRKELLEHCKNQAEPYIQTGNKCPQIQSWIDWLEKQGEHEDEYPLCDSVKDNIRTYIANHFVTDDVVKTDVASIVKAMEEGVKFGKEEQKLVEWTKEDENMLDRAIYMMEQLDMTESWDDVYNWLKSLPERLN